MQAIGVDVGGTFTDFVIYDEDTGEMRTTKTPSTYPDPQEGVLRGLQDLGVDLGLLDRLAHGTTIATNAVIERQGAKTAFITTYGFRDIIETGDTRRFTGGQFNPNWERPPRLVVPQLRFGVHERVKADGEVIEPLNEKDVLEVIEQLKTEKVESVAVGFLHSYQDGRHESRVAELLRQHLPNVPYSISSEVVPEFREHPRFNTTALNAYLMPLLKDYLASLKSSLRAEGFDGALVYMISSGGVASEETALAYPVKFLVSGPAAGVVAGVYLGQLSGRSDLITYDMGGTSTDVCLIKDLTPEVSTRRIVEGFPLLTPMLDVHTIGAGGGSITWVDRSGALRVGPQSAGANPGPAAYGQGGTDFTITDANLLLGRVSPGGLLGGRMAMRHDLAEAAGKRVADQVDISDVNRLAEGVIQIAVTTMSGAIRAISIERGHDPRELTLVAFGGAGSMHAIPIAEELSIPSILVPRDPGNFCATGLLASDLKNDFARSYQTELEKGDVTRMESMFKEMEEEGRHILRRDGVAEERIAPQYVMSLRYLGQSWEIDIPVRTGRPNVPEILQSFHDGHVKTYGYNRPEHPVELVSLRVSVIGQVPRPSLTRDSADGTSLSAALQGQRRVYFGGDFVECPVYQRDLLPTGGSLDGPAIIEEFGSLTVVFPGWSATTDENGTLALEHAVS